MTSLFLQKHFQESHELFAESALRFAKKEIAPHAFDWEEAELFPKELFLKAGQSGLLGVTFPEEWGGGGGDLFHLLAMCRAMLQGGSSGVVVGLGSLEIALPPLLTLGSSEQKERWIRPVLKGEKVSALAITEPNTGSDVSGIRTKAVRQGKDYLLNGSKMFITSGYHADQITVLARTSEEPHMGLTFFVVEKGMKGFSVGKRLKKMGWRASDTAELSFDNCRLPASHRIGEEGSGFLALMENFQKERLFLSALGCFSAEIALQEAESYARERQAFGRNIVGFQVIRHKLAHMSSLVTAANSFLVHVADCMNQGQNAMEEVSSCKNFTSDVAQEVCNQAVQILGGMGYMRESIVERLYRDVRLLPIGGGTTEIMNEIISKCRGYSK